MVDKQRITAFISLNSKTHYCDKKTMSSLLSALILSLCVSVQRDPGEEADSAPRTVSMA